MTSPAPPHRTPGWGRVIAAQLRAVGLTIRREVLGVTLVVAIVTASMGAYAVSHTVETVITPRIAFLVTLAASLLPIAVWKGEYRVRRSYLASMPVDRTRHVLAKIASGWAWLMVLSTAFLIWMLAFVSVTGGEIGVDEIHVLASDLPVEGMTGAIGRHWRTPLWQWAVVFTAPTVAYLFGSAVVLAGSSVRRWLAGIAVVVFFLVLFRDEAVISAEVEEWVNGVLDVIAEGRYGLLSLFAAADAYDLTLATGENVVVWRLVPKIERWALTTLLWTGAALASVLAVLCRDQRG